MENSQQTHNFFFAKISENLKTLTPEKIQKDLDLIFENDCQDLTIKQFELIGSLAYLTGIDFTSQTEKLNPITLSNVTKRFVDQGLTPEIWTIFVKIIGLIHVDNLVEPKELIKHEVSKEIPTTTETIIMKADINNILKNSYIPVKFAANTDLLIKAKKLTFLQLLNFNSLVYEQMQLKGSTIKSVVKMFKTDTLKNLMKEASEKFDNQKYAIIYFDSLITLAEYNSVKPISSNVLFNELLIKQLINEQEQEESKELETITENKPVLEIAKDETPSMAEIDDTDVFLKASIEESLERKIETPQDLIDGFALVAKNEDLMQHVYRYIRANRLKNRKNLDEIYGFSIDSTVEYYDNMLKTNVDKYNNLLLRYLEKIPENLYSRLIDAVDDTIKSLLIENSEHKGYLIQQLYENQITTYKQLHQTINIIESCSIDGSKINQYVALRDLIVYNDDIVNIFEDSQEIENIKLDLQFFTAVKEFYHLDTENAEALNPAR